MVGVLFVIVVGGWFLVGTLRDIKRESDFQDRLIKTIDQRLNN